jgi:hypothetical protein
MPVMKITRHGLCSIAVLTALLWSCIVLERLTVLHARANAYHALDEIHRLQLKRHLVPATTPQSRPDSHRTAVG